jgi:ribonuclease R
MTYRTVNAIINGEKDPTCRYANIEGMIRIMLELSHVLRKKRYTNGCIDFDIPEIKVQLNEKNKVIKVETRERGEAEKLIEDFMVAANETIAEDLYYSELPSIYRTHERPEAEKLKELNRILNKFGYRVSQYEGLHPRQLQQIIEKSKESGTSALIHKLILISLKQAQYTMENTGHFGLASGCYTHFTSPIRRYADLIVHRILSGRLSQYPTEEKKVHSREILPDICCHISKTERLAMKAEEESVKIKVVEYMTEKIGEEFLGTIVGFSKKKIFFNTEENVECYWDLVGAEHFYEFNGDNYTMIDRNSKVVYNVGDKYPIVIARADLSRLEIEVVPVHLLGLS